MTPTDDEDAAVRLLIALSRITRMLRREAPTWLGPASASTLATLVRDGATRPSELAAAEGVRPPTMTRVVAALEADGYVARDPDPSDKRACLVRATEAGEELVRGATSDRARILLARLIALPDPDRALLLGAVGVLESLGTPTPVAERI